MSENLKPDDVSVICGECPVRAKVAQRSLRSEQIWPSIAPRLQASTCSNLPRAQARFFEGTRTSVVTSIRGNDSIMTAPSRHVRPLGGLSQTAASPASRNL